MSRALAILAALWLWPVAAGASPQRSLVIENIAVRGVRVGRRQAMVARTGLQRGMPADEAEIAEARARLLETGLFKHVSPRLVRGSAPGKVTVLFECDERHTTSIDAVHLGHARPTSLWAGLDVSDIDPFGRGFSLGGGFVTSGEQTAAHVEVGRPRAFGEGIGLQMRAHFVDGLEPFVGPRSQRLDGRPVKQVSVPYDRAGLEGRIRLDLTPRTQLAVGLRVEYVEAMLPDGAEQVEADGSVEAFDFGIEDGAGVMPEIGLGLAYDTRDDPTAPRRGHRISLALRGGHLDDAFLVALGSAEQYVALPFGHVLRFDISGGAIAGNAPFFERFFVGDLHPWIPERSLGLNFARRRGPNLLDQGLDEQRYETVAGRAGIEWRIPLDSGPYRTELFFGSAVLSMGTPDEVEDPKGPWLPMDIAFDAGLRITSEFGVAGLSVSNLFLLVDP